MLFWEMQSGMHLQTKIDVSADLYPLVNFFYYYFLYYCIAKIGESKPKIE